MTRMSIDVPSELHKMIKFNATLHDLTIRNYVVEAIEEKLKKDDVPNALTLATFRKSDNGEELHEYDSLDDFFNEMKSD